ncbi:GerAB/ArcD/ProY family transporter [Paenibacillus sp. BC26]|uniref:GerAB/ArcD/ProY family transporter n=1 Tax=Paenibacillus sp. BC26 TaxID=1881032 RepID=UPI0008ED42F8|nr:GerAB/ArcD/ProY family transporter [Paenibacillus sp. BC26]SFS99010.1 Spore germination protein [Paenibacillus sp. BC26]
MIRYYYYNIILVSILNLMLFVPYLLLNDRYTGSVSSMICAAFFGSFLALIFTHVMKTFPGKGLPEILALFFPKYINVPILILLSVMWYAAAGIAIIAYAVLINRFFNPDTSSMLVLLILVGACIYTATRSTLTVSLIMEMTLIINLPIVFFILFKASTNPFLDWDAIRTVAQYWRVPPKLEPFAAATFVFTGYTNYAIFNRLNPPNFRFRFRWALPIICTLILFLSFFVPIGFHGTEAVGSYLYVWTVTSDSMLLGYGFIERVIFLFLLLYLNLTLLYTTSGWHIAMEMIKSCLPKAKPHIDPTRTAASNYVIVSIFAALTMLSFYTFNEKQSLYITRGWLMIRLFSETATVLFLVILSLIARRKKMKT